MTLREVIATLPCDTKESAVEAVFSIAIVVLTASNGRPSTFEEECRWINERMDVFGNQVDKNWIVAVLDSLGTGIVDAEIPQSVVDNLIYVGEE